MKSGKSAWVLIAAFAALAIPIASQVRASVEGFAQAGGHPPKLGATFAQVGTHPPKLGSTFAQVGTHPPKLGATFAQVGTHPPKLEAYLS